MGSRKGLAVSSRTSPPESVSRFDLGIPLHLSCVGSAEADDADAVGNLREAENMDAVPEEADGDIARLAFATLVRGVQRALEIEARNRFEG